ncbi:hypothetical protein B005_4078 [Nocardiopsis alba ATCC BAA-2165]|uniref:Uncharacterized protein n=1 Tax=Nocardiopsis alba (strain ATCC BAA-2165 / BE74) TaxID=1205910 RepID=J7LDC2_NOCAA|nr:hypothetical protein B005_4078 [Nocardiopsis alba ATCC BAA-2165]
MGPGHRPALRGEVPSARTGIRCSEHAPSRVVGHVLMAETTLPFDPTGPR